MTGSYVVPNGVTNIGASAFYFCSGLTSVTIPSSVRSIGSDAFEDCGSLTGVYFQGNAPSADGTVFYSDPGTVYYLPGTTGWTNSFGGLSTALWTLPYPLVLTSSPSFGVRSNQFGFTITWATNLSVVVQACTNLANPVWQPLQTNALSAAPIISAIPTGLVILDVTTASSLLPQHPRTALDLQAASH
jgi:hypothetical protein